MQYVMRTLQYNVQINMLKATDFSVFCGKTLYNTAINGDSLKVMNGGAL